jgi:DNA-binding LacI/PurR family transcriptional regulator
MYEIGRHAFDLLTGAMAGRFDQPQSLILPVELKLRESVAAAKRQRRLKAAGSKP